MDNISTIVLAGSLVIIMFGMGLSLTLNDFTEVFVKPKAILTGLFNQLVLLPLIGFGLIAVFPVRPEIAIGVIILAACPGGPTSNLITHLAKGDTALSVSLTAISSLLTLITIPFIINLGLQLTYGQNTPIQLNVLTTIAQILIIVLIPVGIGMLLRAKKELFADRMQQPVRNASAVVFILVLAGVIFKERSNIVSYANEAGLISLALNLGTMILGLLIARIMHLSFKQSISISIESGIQNGTLAITIATVLLHNSEYAIAPAIYSLIMFGTGSLIILWSVRQTK